MAIDWNKSITDQWDELLNQPLFGPPVPKTDVAIRLEQAKAARPVAAEPQLPPIGPPPLIGPPPPPPAEAQPADSGKESFLRAIGPIVGSPGQRKPAPAPASGAPGETSGGAFKNYLKGFDAQAAELDKDAKAKASDAETVYAERQKNAEALQRAQLQQQFQEEAAAQARQTALASYQQEVDDLKNERVDMRKATGTDNALGQITFLIGSILGGVSQGLGGQNTFMQTMDSVIARNVDAQKANIAMKRAAIAEKKGVLDDKYKADLDLIAQSSKRRAMIYELAEKKVDALAAMQGAKADARRVEMLKAQVQQEKDKSLADYLSAKERAAAAGAAAMANKAWEREKFEREMALKEGQIRAEQGKNINAETKDISGALVHEKLPQLRENIKLLEETMPNAEGVVSSKIPDAVLRVFGGDATLARRQILNSVVQDMGHLKSGAALSANEWAAVERGLGVGSSVQEQQNAIQLLKRAHSATENAILKGYSPQAVETYRARTPGASAVKLDIRPGAK